MAKILKILLIIAFLFNVVAWSGFTEQVTKTKPTTKTSTLINSHFCNTKSQSLKKEKTKDTQYSFLPYEKCSEKNDYLDKPLEKSLFSGLTMNDSKLSPLCTFAGLTHKLSGAYQKSCSKRPTYTRHKPCLTRNYHRFVHNQITMAAECFHMDPKTLFSLYSTESFLQINVKPSKRESAEGISQLMPQYSVKHINQTFHSNNIIGDNQYKKNLRHFIAKAPNKQCKAYLKNLKQTVLKKERKNQCQDTTLDQKVGQDIYYSIAYGLESIKSGISSLISQNSLFNDDYSDFFLNQKDNYQQKVTTCNQKSLVDRNTCLNKSKQQIQNYIENGKNEVNKAIKHLTKSINPIGANNLEEKIVNNFPQFAIHVTSDQFKESKLTALLDNPFVKNYCIIDTIPQLSWYKTHTHRQRTSSSKKLLKDINKLIAEVRECKKQLPLAYVDIFHAMNNNNQLILNEVSFYQHNGGTKMNRIFKRYIKMLGPEKASKLSYKKFTGKRRGSFRSYIVKTDGPSQVSNFLYNTPGRDRRGRRIAGSLASTTHNMKIIKKTLSKLRHSSNLLLNKPSTKLSSLETVNSTTGFKQLCSHY